MFIREDFSNISDAFADLGVSDNAFTYFSCTGYHFRCTSNFAASLKLLLEFTSGLHCAEAQMENVRDVIIQELAMYQDSPGEVLEQNLRRGLFGDHPAGVSIGGTPESVSTISAPLLQACHKAFYHPQQAVLVVVGDLTAEEIHELVAEIDAPVPEDLREQLRPGYALGLPPTPYICQEHTRLPKPLLALGIKYPQPAQAVAAGENPGRALLRRQLEGNFIFDLICGMASSGYWELYRRGLINNTFSSDHNAFPEFAYGSVSSECQQPEALQEALVKLLFQQGRDFIQVESIERLKRKYLGGYVAGFEGFDGLAFDLVATEFWGGNVDDFPQIIQNITRESLLNHYDELFRQEHMAVSLLLSDTATKS